MWVVRAGVSYLLNCLLMQLDDEPNGEQMLLT